MQWQCSIECGKIPNIPIQIIYSIMYHVSRNASSRLFKALHEKGAQLDC
jgi:hypothetical protein